MYSILNTNYKLNLQYNKKGENKMKGRNRILSIILALTLVVGMMPMFSLTAFADDENTQIDCIKVFIKKSSDSEYTEGKLDFKKDVKSYTMDIEPEYSSIYVEAEKGEGDQKITATVDGASLSLDDYGSFVKSKIRNLTKDETVFKFNVTSKDNSANGVYQVTVKKKKTVTVTKIKVTSNNHRQDYKVGEKVDVTNLIIEVTKSDDSTDTMNVTEDMVTVFDTSSPGENRPVTVEYEGKKAYYNINVFKKDGPEAPSGLAAVKPTTLGGNDGKITGTNTTMEYATNEEFTDTAACGGNEITGLKAGTYYVRLKETDTTKAGKAAKVDVPEGAAPTVTPIYPPANPLTKIKKDAEKELDAFIASVDMGEFTEDEQNAFANIRSKFAEELKTAKTKEDVENTLNAALRLVKYNDGMFTISHGTSSLSIKTVSKKLKKNRVRVKAVITGFESIEKLTEKGYKVEYNFFRATKKSGKYTYMFTKTRGTYFNTIGEKGKRYFYKVSLKITDPNGLMVYKTPLVKCKWSSIIY